MPQTDRQLLLRTHRGNGPAAEALWARFSPRLLAYARAIVRDHDAAADIVQGVFLRLLAQPAAAIREVTDVPSWMVRLTRNAAINHVRARRRSDARLRRFASSAPAPIAAWSDPEPTLSTALDNMPRRDREILVLKHIAGLTFDQIALALCMNRNTAAARYRAAITLLRDTQKPGPAAVVGGTSR